MTRPNQTLPSDYTVSNPYDDGARQSQPSPSPLHHDGFDCTTFLTDMQQYN